MSTVPDLFLVMVVVKKVLDKVFATARTSKITITCTLVLNFVCGDVGTGSLPGVVLSSTEAAIVVMFLVNMSSVVS